MKKFSIPKQTCFTQTCARRNDRCSLSLALGYVSRRAVPENLVELRLGGTQQLLHIVGHDPLSLVGFDVPGQPVASLVASNDRPQQRAGACCRRSQSPDQAS